MALSSKNIREPLLRLRSCLAGGRLGEDTPATNPRCDRSCSAPTR